MDSYTFGRRNGLARAARVVTGIGVLMRSIRGVTLRLTRALRRWESDIRLRGESMRQRAMPVTVHITRVVPLDRFTMRIEFTVDRRTRHAYHIFSDTGSYAEQFASFKRGEEVDIPDEFYYVVRDARAEWKRF